MDWKIKLLEYIKTDINNIDDYDISYIEQVNKSRFNAIYATSKTAKHIAICDDDGVMAKFNSDKTLKEFLKNNRSPGAILI